MCPMVPHTRHHWENDVISTICEDIDRKLAELEKEEVQPEEGGDMKLLKLCPPCQQL